MRIQTRIARKIKFYVFKMIRNEWNRIQINLKVMFMGGDPLFLAILTCHQSFLIFLLTILDIFILAPLEV